MKQSFINFILCALIVFAFIDNHMTINRVARLEKVCNKGVHPVILPCNDSLQLQNLQLVNHNVTVTNYYPQMCFGNTKTKRITFADGYKCDTAKIMDSRVIGLSPKLLEKIPYGSKVMIVSKYIPSDLQGIYTVHDCTHISNKGYTVDIAIPKSRIPYAFNDIKIYVVK